MVNRSPEVDLSSLDIGHLCWFVGSTWNRRVTEALQAAGFDGVRQSLGYVIQHLIMQPRTATELAQLMGVSQQAASKSVKELAAGGYVEETPSGTDRRARVVQLSERGWALIGAARDIRAAMQEDLLAGLGARQVASARAVLLHLIDGLGGAEAIRFRRVREEE